MLFSSRYAEYDSFAWFYDRYWGGVFADRYFDEVERLFLSHVGKSANVLDLCCGSGQLAARIAAKGFRANGIDGSAALVKLAKKNAPGAEFSTGDARSFTIIDKFDGVISSYDSLNHIMDLVTLGNVFNNVYSALKKGGIFMFDMNLEEGFKQRWRGSASVIEQEHVLATSATYDSDRKEGRMNVTTFVNQKHWERTDVTIVEHCFTKDEVTNRLSKSLFRDIKTIDSHRDLNKDEAGRMFFICVK